MASAPLKTARRTVAVLGIFLASAAYPAFATVDDEASLADGIVREAIIELDTLEATEKRTLVLEKAVEAMAVLEQLAGPTIDNGVAQSAKADLASQAITADVLRLSLVEALGNGLSAGEPGLKRDLQAKATIAAITDHAYRSAAWSQLARAHVRIGQPAEAERLAMRAIEDALAIDRRPTRDGALRAAILIFPMNGKHPGIVETATNAMTTASARSEIYRMEALAQLVGDRKLSADQLVAMSNKALDAKDYPAALQAARALERDEPRRADLLSGLFEKASSQDDEKLALQILKSMARTRDQDKGLRKLVDLRLDKEKPIRARELISLMLSSGPRIDAEIAVARAFEKRGYFQAAIDTLNALDVSAKDDPDAAADLSSAFAALEQFDKAKAIAETITDPARRSFAFSRLSKRLADDQRLEEAREALKQVTQPDDLAHARSGLARALIKNDELEEVRSLLDDIPEGADRDRVLEELAKRHAGAGRIDDARSTLDAVTEPASRARILTLIATSLGEGERDAARTTLENAEAILRETGEALPDLAAVAVAYAGLGDMQQADAILQPVADRALRDTTEQAIVDGLIRDGDFDQARARIERLSQEARPAAIAALSIARYQADRDVEALIAAVRDLPFEARIPALRTMAEDRARRLDTQQFLRDATAGPLSPIDETNAAQKANFIFGRHVVQAPVASTRKLSGLAIPDIFSLTSDTMRARVPAPANGVAHLAILGFSPFSLEAFKLTSGGTAAIHQVQLSQQLTWPRYIAVEKGVVALGTLLRELPETVASNLLVDKGDTLLVRVPIIVLPGATLLMSGAEFSRYELAAQSGAFLAVAGKLVVQDTEIIGFDEQKNIAAAADEASKGTFRPFITGWGGSRLELAGSRFAMLGYDSSKAFGLTQSSGAAVQSLYATEENRPTGNIVENSFDNLRYGYYSYEATDVKLIANEYRDNIVYGIDPHDRSRDLLIALNTAYGSQKKHGIIVSREVDDSFIVGNVSVWNKGSGLMLDRTSSRNIVYANTAFANSGDGLTFYESGCNIAAANDFSRNHRAGIKVRNSTDVGLYDNHLNDNKTSGADVYISDLRTTAEGRSRNFELDPYQPVSTTVISGNSFAGNGNAINVAGASQTILEANRFRDQRSNIFGGDLRPLSPYLLQLGETSPTLVGTACQPKAEMHACRFEGLQFPQEKEMACTGISQPLRSGTATAMEGNNG